MYYKYYNNNYYYATFGDCYEDRILENKYCTNNYKCDISELPFIGDTEPTYGLEWNTIRCCSKFQTKIGNDYICNQEIIEENKNNI